MGTDMDRNLSEAANFRGVSVKSAPHDDEDSVSDNDKLNSDPEEAYIAVRLVV